LIIWKDIPAMLCTCDICGYSWKSVAAQPPKWCGNKKCRSREWNGKKPARGKIALPAPHKVGRPKTIALADDLF